LNQFIQTLSVAAMFCVQAIDLIAQRKTLYFVHQAPPGAAVRIQAGAIRRFSLNIYIYRQSRTIGKPEFRRQ
jgi:hypothetical protein